MARKPIDPALITPTTPLRLDVAADLAFPGGGMTVSGLRREAERGKLQIERIAGKVYTTLAAIKEMRELCRVQPKAHVSTSTPPKESGSSETERSSAALAALKLSADALKRPGRKRPPR